MNYHPDDPNGKPLFRSVDGTAVRLGVSRRKVYHLIEEGELELKKLSPRISRVTEESIDRYAESRPKSELGKDPIVRWTPEERARRDAEIEEQLAELGL
jgi:excisionase family DNA binding protein